MDAQLALGGGMVRVMRCLVLLAILILPAGCATSYVRAIDKLERGEQPPRILMMPPDVELQELSLGGVAETNAQWTLNAQRHLTTAMRDHLKAIRSQFIEFSQPTDDQEAVAVDQLQKVHGLVGMTIEQFGPFAEQMTQLPSKGGRFDWTLGPQVVRIGQSSQVDYILFIFLRDQYSSGGRKAAKILAAAFLGLHIPGGIQAGYASLVDAKTGKVVWYNHLARESGDLRELPPARETVAQLLDGLPK